MSSTGGTLERRLGCILPGWAGTPACSSQLPSLDCLCFCMASSPWITAKSGTGAWGSLFLLLFKDAACALGPDHGPLRFLFWLPSQSLLETCKRLPLWSLTIHCPCCCGGLQLARKQGLYFWTYKPRFVHRASPFHSLAEMDFFWLFFFFLLTLQNGGLTAVLSGFCVFTRTF